MGFPKEPVASLLLESDRMILRGEAVAMVAVRASEEDAQCFILRRKDGAPAEPVLELEGVVEVAKRIPSPREMIEELARS
jgi:hypothetical protein